jgi:hypothetical protein
MVSGNRSHLLACERWAVTHHDAGIPGREPS